MAFVATIEDGTPKLRGVLDTGVGVENFLERIKSDYVYRSRLNALLRQRRAGSRADVPLGVRQPTGLPSQISSARLPQVAPAPITPTPTGLPQTIIGRAAPSQQGVLYSTVQSTSERRPGMNLSNILGQVTDIARTYYGIRQMRMPSYPTPAPSPIMAQPVSALAPLGSRLLGQVVPGAIGGAIGGFLGDGAVGGFAPPAFPIGEAEMPLDVCKPSDVVYSWDEKLQTYVPKKKRKRRRRQLVTKGDIKGLAALKGVVGTGKIMETWIATHG